MDARMDADALRQEIEQFLAAHHVINLSTFTAAPHVASLMYALDGLSLIWESRLDTRHSQHLVSESRVSATIAPDYSDHREIRGVQVFGTARRLTASDEVEHAKQLLLARYAFIRELAAGPMREKFHSAGFYRLTPKTINFIDCTKGFGNTTTLVVREGGAVALSD